MSEQVGKAETAQGGESLRGCVSAGIAAAGGEAGPVPPVASVGGPVAGEVRSLVDPALVEKTCTQFLRLVERAAGRSLYGAALRASGGDKGFAQSLVAGWIWSEAEVGEVASLVRATAEMYCLTEFLRPDVALLLACGTHAAGYWVAVSGLQRRKAESDKLNREVKNEAAEVPKHE